MSIKKVNISIYISSDCRNSPSVDMYSLDKKTFINILQPSKISIYYLLQL